MATRVNSESFDTEVLSGGTVLADFYSDSCVPCKRMSPVLAEIEEEYGGRIKLVKININFDADLAEKYGVQSVPTLVYYKDGAEVARQSGALKKSDIVAEIEKL